MTAKPFSLLTRCSGSPWKPNNSKTSNVRVNVTPRRVHVIIIAEEKRSVLRILSVCSLCYPA
jgi:hypothetical protein